MYINLSQYPIELDFFLCLVNRRSLGVNHIRFCVCACMKRFLPLIVCINTSERSNGRKWRLKETGYSRVLLKTLDIKSIFSHFKEKTIHSVFFFFGLKKNQRHVIMIFFHKFYNQLTSYEKKELNI